MLKDLKTNITKNKNYIAFNAPEDIAETLRGIAELHKVKITDIVIDALREYFKANKITFNFGGEN